MREVVLVRELAQLPPRVARPQPVRVLEVEIRYGALPRVKLLR